MTVVLNPAGLVWALESPFGPTGIVIGIKAEEVREKAYANANNQILQVRTKALRDGIRAHVGRGLVGLEGTVGTDAVNPRDDFNYPSFLDETGFPWLTGAMRDVFAGG